MYGSAIAAYSLGLITINYWSGMKQSRAKSPNTVPDHHMDNASYTAEEISDANKKIKEFTKIIHMCISNHADDKPSIDNTENHKAGGPSLK